VPLTPLDVRNRKFGTTRLSPGYAEDEVSAFLDLTAAELDVLVRENRALASALADARAGVSSGDVRIPPPSVHHLIPADINNARFTTTRLRPGYDIHEVVDFLDEVAREIARLTEENNEFRRELFSELRITKMIEDHDQLPRRPDDWQRAESRNPDWGQWARIRHSDDLGLSRDTIAPASSVPAVARAVASPGGPPSAALPPLARPPLARPPVFPAPVPAAAAASAPPGTVMPLQAGDPVQVGGYRLLGRLGAGGMGRVFLGASPGGRKVAVKLLHPDRATDPGFRARFAHEVTAAGRVSGFYTAPVVDADPGANPPWLVTAFIPGPSLHNAIAERGPLRAEDARMLGAALAEGLAAIHACGLIHRDLKPGNIVLADDGPRIIDFGLARSADIATLTATGTLIGTFPFMSPEQIRNQPVGPETDIFSLGSVLAYAVTGRCPFDAPFPAVAHLIVHEPPDLSGIGGPLRDLIAWCLEKEPGDPPKPGELLPHLNTPASPWQAARQPPPLEGRQLLAGRTSQSPGPAGSRGALYPWGAGPAPAPGPGGARQAPPGNASLQSPR
jgi:DivIVA domain-containing protein